MTMKELQQIVLQEIINCEGTVEKIAIMKKNTNLFKNIQIALFDEESSNFEDLENRNFGKYHLCSIGDYCKMWILDNNNTERVQLNVAKRVYFDINIISRIDDYLNGKIIDDELDLVDFLNYIKNENYDLEIGNSVIERLSKSYNEKLFRRSMESFYKYLHADSFGKELASETVNQGEFERFYNHYKQIGQMCNDDNLNRQYDFIFCMMMKAIIIKADKKCCNKVDELVKFCLNELKCIMINELYLLCLYLENNQDVIKHTFAKFHSSIKNGLENAVRNTTWDIYHARFIEQEMSLYDEKTQMVILPYFATNDRGVKDYWSINPRKMVVIKDNRPINIYIHNIGDIETMINDKNLYYQIVDPSNQIKRRIEINNINIIEVKTSLLAKLKNVTI